MKQDSTSTNLNIACTYADAVIKGDIIACKYIIQACKLFKSNIERDDLYIDEIEIDKVITFINSLKLTEASAGKYFILQAWQTFIIVNVYGFYYKATGERKHKRIFINVPRKSGKSMLTNALALYETIFENEAQAILGSNSAEQTRKVGWKQTKIYCDQLDPKKKHLKAGYNKIKYNNSEMLLVHSDSKTLSGLNCSAGFIDEYQDAKSNSLYNIIATSQGARTKRFMFVISTASDWNIDGCCYTMLEYCKEILEGKKVSDQQFSMIYTIDEGDDITDKNTWYKSNPSLGVTVQESFFVDQLQELVNNPLEATTIKAYYFNVWANNKAGNETKFIDREFIKSSMQKIDINEDRFKDVTSWVGVDLSCTSDLTATATMIQLDDKFYFFIKYYLPENSRNTGINKKQFLEWANQGYIELTSGNVVDYDRVTEDLVELNRTNEINQISYDPYNSSQWAINTTEAGLFLVQFNQTSTRMNQPLKELSRLMMKEQIVIQYNPVTEWCFNNAIVIEKNALIKVDKTKISNKIDGLIACTNAFGGYLENNRQINIF